MERLCNIVVGDRRLVAVFEMMQIAKTRINKRKSAVLADFQRPNKIGNYKRMTGIEPASRHLFMPIFIDFVEFLVEHF